MRISRADPDDPTGKRRRHFEISIDSPFTVLNCRATQANTALPQYSGRDGPTLEQRQQMACGCPDAPPLDPSVSGLAGPLIMVEEDIMSPSGRRLRLDCPPGTRPGMRQSNSVNRGTRLSPVDQEQEQERPIHLLRHPSHNPPAFDADEPPPPLPSALLTPPPHYDLIVGTPSVDGLADYFARLAAYENMEQVATKGTVGPGDSSAGGTPGPSTGQPASSSAAGLASTSGSVSYPLLGDVTVDPFNNIRVPARPTTGGDVQEPMPSNGDGNDEQPEAEGDTADDTASSTSEDSTEDDQAARPHRRGRVNVANPRTPGGRLVPSRSLEIERPMVRLDMTGVLRRRGES